MDDTTTTQPQSEPTVGPQPAAPHEFAVAWQRLNDASRGVEHALYRRLQRATELHDLSRSSLIAAQRELERLKRRQLLPSPAAYWKMVAVPRAALLTESARAAITEESAVMSDFLDRFLTASRRSTLEPWASAAEGQLAIRRSGTIAADRILAAVPPTTGIDELGEWWQRRLRRAATVHSLPHLLLPADANDVIDAAEMFLLDQPPWSFTDRLLSAFELAHSEIRSVAHAAADQLHQRVGERCDTPVTSERGGQSGYIELRD